MFDLLMAPEPSQENEAFCRRINSIHLRVNANRYVNEKSTAQCLPHKQYRQPASGLYIVSGALPPLRGWFSLRSSPATPKA